jgi:DNA-binding MarR family transcriptional regulator/L-amino acid N-acyltransferase YncA
MKNLSITEINQLRSDARSVVRELGLLNDSYFEVDVTVAERHLLIELALLQEPVMGELAERLLLDKSTISRLIARALKKGYVKTVVDKKDKRRRFVHITKKGMQILNTFEPIAFEQTKNALLTLKPDEIQTVYQGIACYAKGLRSSRLQEANELTTLSSRHEIESLQVILKQLHQQGYSLDKYDQSHEEGLYKIFQQVVDTGMQFPYELSSMQSFREEFIRKPESVYVCHRDGKVIGGFYLRANYSGRCNHIANAAYMVIDTHRGHGIGALMLKASLHLAKQLGLHAMQFNMVLSQNINAVSFYEKFGFKVVGTIPNAVRMPDNNYQDGFIMYRELNDLK